LSGRLFHRSRGARLRVRLLSAALLVLFSQVAAADLSIVGTRFIYPAGLAALSIRVGNLGTSPLLLQAWLDKGDASADPSQLAVPFVLSPPLSRLNPQQSSVLSLRHSGEPLPADRESVFWLNFLEVPSLQALSSNQLRVSYRLRMKLLYRPQGLPGRADEAVQQLSWSLQQGGKVRRSRRATRRRTTCPWPRWSWATAANPSPCRASPSSRSARCSCPWAQRQPSAPARQTFDTKWF